MSDERLRNKSELKRLFTGLLNKRLTDEMMSIAIDSLWRERNNQRTSGFEFPAHFDSVISFDPLTRIFSIKPFDPLVENWLPRFGIYAWTNPPVFNRIYDTMEIVIPNEEGLFCVYFDDEPGGTIQILFYKKNPTPQELETIYISKVLVSCFYWDAENGELLHFGEDRHGSEWNPQIHWYLHKAFAARRKSGLQFTDMTVDADGTDDAHAKLKISSGIILHDDIELPIPQSQFTIPVLYFGAAHVPRYTGTTGYGIQKGANLICFNNNQNEIVECTSGNFCMYHLFAVNEIEDPNLVTISRKIISVMGTSQYSKLGAVYAALDSELNSIYDLMPQQGRCYLGSIIIQTSTDFLNSIKARIVRVLNSGTGEDGNGIVSILLTNTVGLVDTYTITYTDTTTSTFNVTNGTVGADGNTPYIQGGYWYIDGVDTGILAVGQNGDPGAPGADGADASVLTGTPVDNGALYSWYAAFDNRKISSSDAWDIVTYTQLQELGDIVERTLNGYNGHFKLMESGTVHWQIANGTDDFGLNIRGTGRRSSGASATFGAIRQACFIWINHTEPTIWEFMNTQDNFYFTSRNLAGQKTEGNPLRLTRAATTAELLLPNGTPCENYVGNNLISYPTVKIGSTIYMSSNLNETKYRNGNWITGFDNGVYTPITNAIWGAKTTEAMCYYSDNEDTGGLEYLPGLIGPKGADGKGIVSIILTNTVGLVDTYTITYTDTTTSTFDVTNGTVGADGNTPYIQGGYWYIDGVDTGVLAVGQNGLPGTPGTNGTNGLNGIDAGGGFEFCVVGGIAQTETLDIYASSNFTITKLVAESDGTLTSVTVKIGATAVTGINAVSVSTLAVFNATALNAVVAGNRITIVIGTGYSGTPTIIRGKLICAP